MINFDLYDRYVTIEQSTPTKRTSDGQEIDAWSTFLQTWARKMPVNASEAPDGQELVSNRIIIWSIPYCDLLHRIGEVKPTMRLVDDMGRVHRIEGVHEGKGRHEETIIRTTIEDPKRGT